MNNFQYQLELPERYDELERMALPHYDTFFSTVIEFIPKQTKSILELASGTGFLTQLIRREFNEAQIVCSDINPDMMAVARKKPELSDVQFCTGDIIREIPDGTFDAVLLTQCLFALPREKIPEILLRIRQALSTGGVFVYGDIFEPMDKWEFELYVSHWREQMIQNGMSEAETDLMVKPLEPMIKGYSPDYVRKELINAGFIRVIFPYWYEMYGVMVAYT